LRDSTVSPATASASAASGTGINCFGCAPGNQIGLHLVFTEHTAGLATRINLGPDYESFPGIVHGGIVATILDEILAQAVHRSGRDPVMTIALRVRYGRPMRTGIDHDAYAKITHAEAGRVQASGRIEQPGGDLVAAAHGTFFLLTDDVLSRSAHLPERLAQAMRASAMTHEAEGS
jgi:uncharacterized protein (TIGR00369 family)